MTKSTKPKKTVCASEGESSVNPGLSSRSGERDSLSGCGESDRIPHVVEAVIEKVLTDTDSSSVASALEEESGKECLSSAKDVFSSGLGLGDMSGSETVVSKSFVAGRSGAGTLSDVSVKSVGNRRKLIKKKRVREVCESSESEGSEFESETEGRVTRRELKYLIKTLSLNSKLQASTQVESRLDAEVRDIPLFKDGGNIAKSSGLWSWN